MQSVMLPKFPQLKGEEAITALNNFIKELEEKRDKKLTKKQTKTLKKFAKGLISSIEAEQSRESPKTGFFSRLRASILGRSQKSGGT